MKKGISLTLTQLFPTIILGKRIPIISEKIESKYWLIGFIEGQGNFYIKIKKLNNEIRPSVHHSVQDSSIHQGWMDESRTGVAPQQISAVFSISQHSEDKHLMNLIKNYLNCGKLELVSTRPNTVNFIVYKIKDISQNVITLFESSPLFGIKRLDFEDFYEAVFLIEKGKHLTEDGKKTIVRIKERMNTKRKF